MVDAENIAVVILEPIQGETEFIVLPNEFVNTLKEKCEKNDIFFIADEIQIGFCRTGKMFAGEY